jgi:hypothetical protein
MQPPLLRVRPLLSSLAAAVVVLVLLGAVVLVPAWAAAVVAVPTTSKPVIAGTPQAGATLTGAATWTGDPPPTLQWQWLRCADAKGNCAQIADATTARYVVVGADVGSLLRVRVTVTNSEGSDTARSDPTTVVTAAPPAPAPTPAPTPTPAPPPAPTASPSPAPPAATATSTPGSTAAQPAPTSLAAPTAAGSAAPVTLPTRLLRPFPIVRIAGLLTPAGARVTLLTVRAPRGSRITVRCRGRLCPRPRLARIAAVLRLRDLERELPAGTRIDITITKRDFIGKWTTIKIRRGAPPARLDRCMYPGGRRPFTCPV